MREHDGPLDDLDNYNGKENITFPEVHPNRGKKRNIHGKKGRKLRAHQKFRKPWEFKYNKTYDGVKKISPLFDMKINLVN